MLEVQAKISGKLIIKIEAKDQVGLFEELASTQEVFGIDKCGKCGSNDIKYVVRTDSEDNKYYELHCNQCKARLTFGENKKGGSLFPRRKDKDKKYLPNNGWTIYTPSAQSTAPKE